MKIINKSIFGAMLLLTACSGNPLTGTSASSGIAEKSLPPRVVETAAPDAEIKIMHYEKVLASYKAAGPDAALDKEYQTLGLSLNSSDNKHMLMIVAEEVKAGVHPVSADEKSKVSIMFTSDVLPTPSLAFDKGELNITELTDKHCSGTFSAVGTAGSKPGYSVKAVFSKLPVVLSARDSGK